MMATASAGPGPAPLVSTPRPGVELFRPRMARIVGLAVGTLVLGAMVVLAILMPSTFTTVDRIGFVLFGAAVFGFCWRQATVRLIASEDRVVVRNLFSGRELEWPEIVAVSFPEGDAWAHLDLADGDTLATMALQRADGADGIAAARHLSRLVRERGEAADVHG